MIRKLPYYKRSKSILTRKIFVLVIALFCFVEQGVGQNVSATWSGGAGTGIAWYTTNNWAGSAYAGSQGVAASNSNIATFTSVGTGNPFGINMTTASLNLGAVSIDNTRTIVTNIGNSGATAGVLRLYGATVNSVANVIVRNNGTGLFTLQAAQSGTMGIVLSNITENIINIDNSGGVTISSIISDLAGGAKNLTRNGAGSGILTLGGANTFSGTFTTNSGTTNLGISGPTVNGTLGSVSSVIVNAGAVLQTGFGTGTNAINDAASVTLNGTGKLDLSGGSETVASLASASSSSSLVTGDFSGSAGSFTVGDATASVTFAGVISGNRASAGSILTKQGSGIWILTGANTYTATDAAGVTTVTAGTLQLNRMGGATIPDTSKVSVTGGTLKISTNQTLANLTIANGAFLVIDAGVTLIITGTLTNNGTITNNGMLSKSATFSNSGAYQGSGAYTGSLFTNSGIVSPGNSPGCQSFGSGFTSPGTLDIEVTGSTPCTQHDKITVTGTATLTGGTLALNISYTPTSNTTLTIIDASNPLTTTFTSVTGLQPNWAVNYNTGDGNVELVYTAPPGAALDFDGTDDYVELGTGITTTLNGSASITVEAWVYPTALNLYNVIAGDYTGGGFGGLNYLLRIDNNKVLFSINNAVFSYSTSTLTPNQWYHIAGTWDGNTVKIYINGVLDVSTAYSGIFSSNIHTSHIGNQPAGGGFFTGSIDEVRIWTVARTQVQIANNMNCEINDFPCGLLVNYHFNQGIAGGINTGINSLTDGSGNGYTGTLTNFALTGSTSNWITPGGVTSGSACSAYLAAEINVEGNNTTITDGDVTPGSGDHTDFGNVSVGNNLIRTYTIQNTGAAVLAVSSVTLTGGDFGMFSVGTLTPASPVAANGGTATFTVTFAPTSAGLKTTTVHIANDDCDEFDYDFAIQGNGACGTPVVPTIIGPNLVCGYAADVDYSTEAGMSNYVWTVTGGGVIDDGDGTATILVDWSNGGIGTVSVTYIDNGCASSQTDYPVTIDEPYPTLDPFSGTCSNSQVEYTTEAGMSNYYWNVTNGTIISGGTDNTVTIDWDGPGMGIVEVSYTNGNQCASVNPFYSINLFDPPVIYNVTGNGGYCSGGAGVIISLDNSEDMFVSYELWLDGNPTGEIIQGDNGLISFNAQTTEGNYTVVATNADGCTSVMNNSVDVVLLPDGSWTGAVSDDWFDPDNWCGGVPTATTDVVIPNVAPNYTLIDGNAVCHHITINYNASLELDGSSTLSVLGNWNNGGAFIPNQGELTMGGSSPQTMSGSVFYDLIINNTSGVTLFTDEEVTNSLILLDGVVTTNANTMIIDNGATVIRTSGHINGNLKKTIPIGSFSTTFEVGSLLSASYAPATLDMINVTGTVEITGSAIQGTDPNDNVPTPNSSGVDGTNRCDHYWVLTQTGGGSFDSYDITLDFTNTTNGGTEANYIMQKFDPSPDYWTSTTSSVTGSTITATGLTNFSDFEVGEASAGCINPTVVDAGPDITVCGDGEIGLGATVTGAATSWIWNGGVGVFNPDRFDLNATYTPDITEFGTTVTLTLVADAVDGCPAEQDELEILVNNPSTADAGPDIYSCIAGSVNLSGLYGGGAIGGYWTGGAGYFDPPGMAVTEYFPDPSESGQVVTLTFITELDNGDVCVPATDDMDIIFDPVTIADAGSDQTICYNGSATLAGNIIDGIGSGVWSTSGDGTFDDPTLLNAVYIPGAGDQLAGSVILTLTPDNANICPVSTDDIEITLDNEVLVNAGPDIHVCEDGNVGLGGTVSGGVTTGHWLGGLGTFDPDRNDLNAFYSPDPSEAGTTVILTLESDPGIYNCNGVTDQLTLTVDGLTIVDAGPDITTCITGSTQLSGIISGGSSNGHWEGGLGTFSPNNNALNAEYFPHPSEAGQTITLTLYADLDVDDVCVVPFDNIDITFDYVPTAGAGIDQSVCAGSTVSLSGSITNGTGTGVWSSAGDGTFNNDTFLNAVYTPGPMDISNGSVILTLTPDPFGVCPAQSDDMLITVASCTATLNLTAFLEGYYTSPGTMVATLFNLGYSVDPTATDTVIVQLWDSLNLAAPAFADTAIIHSDGTVTLTFPGAVVGNKYYIAFKHRNTIETWSRLTVLFSGTTTYNFSNAMNKAYDNGINAPMVNMGGGVFACYGGDVTQDGTVDGLDMNDIEIYTILVSFGYDYTDATGDGATDGLDMNIVEINTNLVIFFARPY